MKFIELITILFLLSIFGFFISGNINAYQKLSKKNYALKNEISACKFISESFRNTCDGNGFDSLYIWQKNCAAMWNLKYIGWCDAKDFLPIPKEYNKKLLYGKWIGPDWEGEVYWEVANEK